MFHGYDFDNTMLRIGSMNMALHGVDAPDIRYKDSLSEEHAGDEEKYSLILANPPSRAVWTTRTRRRTCWPSSRRRRRSCSSWRSSFGC